MAFPTVHTVGVNFGVGSSISNATGAFQSMDHESKSDIEQVRDGNGNTVTKVFFDPMEEATFEYVATGAAGSSTTTVQTGSVVGGLLTVTDTNYPAIAGSTWLVENVSVKGSNTTSKRVTLKLTRYPNITS